MSFIARYVARFAGRPGLTQHIAQNAILPSLSVRMMGGAAEKPSVNDLTDHIISILSHNSKLDDVEITSNSHFIQDLGLDSLDVVECIVFIEDEFSVEIPDEEAETIFTPRQAAEILHKYHP
eukprot:m.5366 g.5366  ORF g.5366 m.5366 type:complete len:122 (+) comp4213_c0_seq1:116-481(+)